MAYEPTGKSKPFVDAVRREPARIWTPAEAAVLMGVSQSSVGAWLSYPMQAKVVFRGKRGGQVVYSGQEFPPEAAYPTPAERNQSSASEDPRAPKFGEPWTPPKMIATRPGSEHPRVLASSPKPEPLSTPQGLCPGCTRSICAEKGCVVEVVSGHFVSSTPAPKPAATPAPTTAPAPAPTAAPTPAPTPAPTSTPPPTPAPTPMPTPAPTSSPAAAPEIPRFGAKTAPVSTEPSTIRPRTHLDSGEAPAHEGEFDLRISLRTGDAELLIPGHRPVKLTSEMREQLAEWLAPTEKAA